MLRLRQTSLRKSDPESEKNGTPASPATALASNVLPVPGGPTSNAPFGSFALNLCVSFWVMKKIYHLCQCFLRFSLSRNICKCHSCLLLNVYLCIGLSNPHHAAASSHHHDKESKNHDRRDQTDQY